MMITTCPVTALNTSASSGLTYQTQTSPSLPRWFPLKPQPQACGPEVHLTEQFHTLYSVVLFGWLLTEPKLLVNIIFVI